MQEIHKLFHYCDSGWSRNGCVITYNERNNCSVITGLSIRCVKSYSRKHTCNLSIISFTSSSFSIKVTINTWAMGSPREKIRLFIWILDYDRIFILCCDNIEHIQSYPVKLTAHRMATVLGRVCVIYDHILSLLTQCTMRYGRNSGFKHTTVYDVVLLALGRTQKTVSSAI